MQQNGREICRRFVRGHCEFGDQCRYWHSAVAFDYNSGAAAAHYHGNMMRGGRGRRGGGRQSFAAEHYRSVSEQGPSQVAAETVYLRQEWRGGHAVARGWGRQNGWGWQMGVPSPPSEEQHHHHHHYYGGAQRGRGRHNDRDRNNNAWGRGGYARGGARGSPEWTPRGRGGERSSRQRPTPATFDAARKWSFNNDNDAIGAEGESMMVMSYNLLSSANAKQHKSELYNHIPWSELGWIKRWATLEREIQHWSADIIALQEVDQYEDVHSGLSKVGYDGMYSKRSGGYTDGCAIFWRKSRFRAVEMESIDFGTMDMRNNAAQLVVLECLPKEAGGGSERADLASAAAGSGSAHAGEGEISSEALDEKKEHDHQPLQAEAGSQSGKKEDDVPLQAEAGSQLEKKEDEPLQAEAGSQPEKKEDEPLQAEAGSQPGGKEDVPLQAESQAGGKKVLVSNIHVLFNPKRGDIKLGQLRVLTERVQLMVEKHGGGIPALMCGDFNMTPNAALYNFMAQAHLDCRTVDRRNMSGQLECTRTPMMAAALWRQNSRQLTPRFFQQQQQQTPTPPTPPPLDTTTTTITTTTTTCVSISSNDKEGEGNEGVEVEDEIEATTEGELITGGDEGVVVSIAVEAVRLEQLGVRTPKKARKADDREEEKDREDPAETVVEALTMKKMCFETVAAQGEKGDANLDKRVEVGEQGEGDMREGEDGEGERAGDGESVSVEEVEGEMMAMDGEQDGGMNEGDETVLGSGKGGNSGKKREWGAEEDSEDDNDDDDEVGAPAHQGGGNNDGGGGGGGGGEERGVSWDPEELYRAVGKDGDWVVSHSLPLKSAYAAVKGADRTAEGEPLLTTYHASFMGTVDYIWHTPELYPVRVLETLPPDTVQSWGGLPRGCWASDHFSLLAEFKVVS